MENLTNSELSWSDSEIVERDFSSYSESESDDDHPLEQTNVLAYSHQPRWSEDKKRDMPTTKQMAVTATTTLPPNPKDIPAVSIAEWDGKDDETEAWRLEEFKWCRCGNCQQMQTVHECVCCHDLVEAEEKGVSVCGGPGDLTCLVDHDRFYNAVIAEDVLSWQIIARAVDTTGEKFPDPVPNRVYRYQAYRQVTYFLHGRLGKSFRRVIPSCVVWAIRKKYESQDGTYRGFLHADEAVADYHYRYMK